MARTPAQQFAGGEPQLAVAQLHYAAPPHGQLIPALPWFFLNHQRLMRSQLAERVGKSPRELTHPHWLPCWASDWRKISTPELGRLIDLHRTVMLTEIRPPWTARFRVPEPPNDQ